MKGGVNMIDHHILSMLREVKKHCITHKRKHNHCDGCKYSFIDREDNCVDCAVNYPDIWELYELEKKGVI